MQLDFKICATKCPPPYEIWWKHYVECYLVKNSIYVARNKIVYLLNPFVKSNNLFNNFLLVETIILIVV